MQIHIDSGGRKGEESLCNNRNNDNNNLRNGSERLIVPSSYVYFTYTDCVTNLNPHGLFEKSPGWRKIDYLYNHR